MRSIDKPAASIKATGKIRKKAKSSTQASLDEIARILEKGFNDICRTMCEVGEKKISAMKELEEIRIAGLDKLEQISVAGLNDLEQIRREEEAKRQHANLEILTDAKK